MPCSEGQEGGAEGDGSGRIGRRQSVVALRAPRADDQIKYRVISSRSHIRWTVLHVESKMARLVDRFAFALESHEYWATDLPLMHAT